MSKYYDYRGYRSQAAYRMNGVVFGSNVRIGDAERSEAIAQLNEHYAAGRLTRVEHDERVDFAMAAKTQADLIVLFADLPQPQRAVESAPKRHGGFGLVLGPVLGMLILVAVVMTVFWGMVMLFKALPFLLIAAFIFFGFRAMARHRRRW